MSEMEYIPVVAVEAVADKSFECLEVEGQGIVICHLRGEFFALENRCSHALATFDEGRMRGPRLMCPLHGATFDIRNGACMGPPATQPIRSFPTRVRDGMVEICLGEN